MVEIEIDRSKATDAQNADWRYSAMSMHFAFCKACDEIAGRNKNDEQVMQCIVAANALKKLLTIYGIDPLVRADVEEIMGNKTEH